MVPAFLIDGVRELVSGHGSPSLSRVRARRGFLSCGYQSLHVGVNRFMWVSFSRKSPTKPQVVGNSPGRKAPTRGRWHPHGSIGTHTAPQGSSCRHKMPTWPARAAPPYLLWALLLLMILRARGHAHLRLTPRSSNTAQKLPLYCETVSGHARRVHRISLGNEGI